MNNITIIIPCYNSSKTIVRTLSSLSSQLDKNFKVVIIDDCSQDSNELLENINIFKNLLNITYHRNSENIGCGNSRQVGVELCDTDYIMFLDSDDVLIPYAMTLFNNSIIKYPEIDLFVSDFYKEENNSISIVSQPYTWIHGKLYKRKFLKDNEIKLNFKGTSEDVYLNVICCTLGECIKIDTPTMIWCENKKSVTRDKTRGYTEFFLSDYIRAFRMAIQFCYEKGQIVPVILKQTNYINKRVTEGWKSFSEEEKSRIQLEFELYNNLLLEIDNSDLIKQKIKEEEEVNK